MLGCRRGAQTHFVYSLVGGLFSGRLLGSMLVMTDSLAMWFPCSSPSSNFTLIKVYGSPTSFQWLGVDICICLSQLLVGAYRGQPGQAPICKHIIAPVIVSGTSHPTSSHEMVPKLGWSMYSLSFSLFFLWSLKVYEMRKIWVRNFDYGLVTVPST